MNENLQKYLKSSYLCESESNEVKDLARKIVGKNKGLNAAKLLFRWVRDNVDYDILKMVGAKKVLYRKPIRAMCIDKTNLFITLCRSIEIPAKYVIMKCELKTKRKDLPSNTLHVISEIYVNDNWIIVDPTFGKSSKKLIEVNRFGKPCWDKIYSIKRTDKISFFFSFLINLFIKFSKTSRILKKAIEDNK